MISNVFGKDIYNTYECDIYVSRNERYCMVIHMNNGSRRTMETMSEFEVKTLMKKYDYEKYCLLFGELEEA
jgi:hypothetical protein